MIITVIKPGHEIITSKEWLKEYPRLIELCGRVCYKSEDKITSESANKFIKMLIKSGHHSVIEHAAITVKIIGDRSMSHQLVRHRIAAFCVDGEAITELTQKSRNIKRRTIRELFEMTKNPDRKSRLKLVKLNQLDESTGNIIQGKVKNVYFNGKKECVEFDVEGGYRLRSTLDHLFFTLEGWMPLSEIFQKHLAIAVNGEIIPDQDWLRQEYLVKDRTRKELAKELKMSYGWICKYLTKYGLKKSKLVIPDIDWLRKEYLEKNRERKDIAVELGISDVWLGKIIRSFKLQKPKSIYPNRHPGHGNPGMHNEIGCKLISERMKGEKNHRWRGGITRKGVKVRKDAVTHDIRKQVYERDDFTCRLCNKRGGKLTIHHVIPLYQDISSVGDLKNMITLCRKCHYKINGHEHEYTNIFNSLTPIVPSPRIEKSMLRKRAIFKNITTWHPIGEIDTYDIEMEGPYNNFIANGVITHNSQESQRYCNYGKLGLQIVCPPKIGLALGSYEVHVDGPLIVFTHESGNTITGERTVGFAGSPFPNSFPAQFSFLNSVMTAYGTYLLLLDQKIPPEDARSVLPNATKTEVTTTFNLRQWRHVFEERALNRHAQWQIREIMCGILKEFAELLPDFFADQAEKIGQSK